MCRAQALDAGEGAVELPEGAAAATVTVFFQTKNVKNLIPKETKTIAGLSQEELMSVPAAPLGLDLVNLNDQPTLASKYFQFASNPLLSKPGQSRQPPADLRMDTSLQNKYKLLYRTTTGRAAICSGVRVRCTGRVKKAQFKLAAGATLQELLDFNSGYSLMAPHGPEVSINIPDVSEETYTADFNQAVVGQYFMVYLSNVTNPQSL